MYTNISVKIELSDILIYWKRIFSSTIEKILFVEAKIAKRKICKYEYINVIGKFPEIYNVKSIPTFANDFARLVFR